MPVLLIFALCSDFCATCTIMCDTIETNPGAYVRGLASIIYLYKYFTKARTEFQIYNQYQNNSTFGSKSSLRHFVFDYAGNSLLP